MHGVTGVPPPLPSLTPSRRADSVLLAIDFVRLAVDFVLLLAVDFLLLLSVDFVLLLVEINMVLGVLPPLPQRLVEFAVLLLPGVLLPLVDLLVVPDGFAQTKLRLLTPRWSL